MKPAIQLRAVIRKEVHQTVRDRRIMFMLVVAPLLQTVAFGYAVNFDVDRVPTVVVDRDRTPESRAHLRRLLADGTLVRAGEAASAEEAETRLERGETAAAIVIPAGFGDEMLAGRPARVQVLLDGTDPNRSGVASATVSRYFAGVAQRLVLERSAGCVAAGGTLGPGTGGSGGGSGPGDAPPASGAASASTPCPPTAPLELRPRVLYNPALATPPFMIPGMLVMVLLIVTTVVTAMGLSREREMGTLEQILVTPVHPLVLLVGKMIPFVVIGLLDIALIVNAGLFLFDLPLRGPLWVLALGAVLYLFSTLGVGLLISTVSRTQQQSFLAGFLFVLPAVLLSGVMTPIHGMPGWLQAVTWLNPVRYVIEIMRANLLKGAGFLDLWPRLLALAAFGVGILAIAVLRFRKRVA